MLAKCRASPILGTRGHARTEGCLLVSGHPIPPVGSLLSETWRNSAGRRITGAISVSATFQDGSKFGSGLTVRKVRHMASAGRKLT
jgi:hypothetical protein